MLVPAGQQVSRPNTTAIPQSGMVPKPVNRFVTRRALQAVPGPILLATILFNPVLAWINAHVAPVSAATVAASQAMLVGLALGVVILARPEHTARWVVFLWATTLGFLLLTVGRGHLELRYLSDIAVIPLFIMLGHVAHRRTAATTLIVAQALLVGFALFEMIWPQSFGAFFNVSGYYVNTRGFDPDAFWAGQDLFLSSERPTGRLLFPNLEVHRASSLFLEPVSLGNWTIVVAIALAALRPVLRRWEMVFLLATNLVLLVACDGRLAMLINLLLLLNWFVAPRLPRFLPAFYLPAVLVCLIAASGLGLLTEHGDTLAGRLRYGVDFLLGLDVPTLLGLYAGATVLGADSGWSYFIGTQSLITLIVLWLMLTFPPPVATKATARTISATALFVSLSLPVSYSLFSIKTAAMLWTLYGIARSDTIHPEEAPSTSPYACTSEKRRTEGNGDMQIKGGTICR